MNVNNALAQMRGKTIGALLHPDGSARLQWPYTDGTLPPDMGRFQVVDARIEGDVIAMELESPAISFTFSFELSAIERQG